jgi:geranylgeranyl diphosphate synthase type II
VNDILDVIGDPKELGKNTGVDKKSNKFTYPLLYGLKESKDKAQALLDRAREAVADYYDEAEIFNGIIDYLEEAIH